MLFNKTGFFEKPNPKTNPILMSYLTPIRQKIWRLARPHPNLLPPGEGTAIGRTRFYEYASRESSRTYFQKRSNDVALSLEERDGVRTVVKTNHSANLEPSTCTLQHS